MTVVVDPPPKPQYPAQREFLETSRRDDWWVPQLLTLLGFGTFIVYSTWAAFQGKDYHNGYLLSPMYSPLFVGDGPHSWFGAKPESWPALLSPAFFILWAPGGFRFTCYYYRGAYYKAFWGDPPGCSIGEPRKVYLGENSLPLILQNLHRYFLYLAIAFIGILSYDAISATRFFTEDGGTERGLSVGTLVMTLNVVLLGGYTFGCHSFRHLVGGFKNVFSKSPARKKCYDCVSALNKRHMLWAWMSLFWVGFTDLYVRLCAKGLWTDWRIF